MGGVTVSAIANILFILVNVMRISDDYVTLLKLRCSQGSSSIFHTFSRDDWVQFYHIRCIMHLEASKLLLCAHVLACLDDQLKVLQFKNRQLF